MTTQLFIITGASRGLGLAIAEQLLQPDHRLLCLSRQTRDALDLAAREAGAACDQWTVDLAQPREAAARLQAWLGQFQPEDFATATLINNAGVITRVGPLDECGDTELSAAMRVGLEAPMLLTAAFLRGTSGWTARRRVLNISSGLGRRAMAGSAAYCAAKAGLDHFSRALALDEAQRPNGARVVSLAPGVIDTDMQVQLRSADPAGFPDLGNFIKLKDDGLLTSPKDAAQRVLGFLQRPDFGGHPVADVRDA